MEIFKPNFYFITATSPQLYVLLYESESNSLVLIELLAKWFKKYMDNSVLVDMSVDIRKLPDKVFTEILIEQYEFIKTKFICGKYKLTYKFGEKTKSEILKELDTFRFDSELVHYLSNENNLHLFKKALTSISRKEKIAKLIN